MQFRFLLHPGIKYHCTISKNPGSWNMPLNILQNIIQKENRNISTIGTLVAQIGTEHFFTNADINNWIQEEFHVESNEEQIELSDTDSEDLYDSDHEENKIKVDDCIKSINICIQ